MAKHVRVKHDHVCKEEGHKKGGFGPSGKGLGYGAICMYIIIPDILLSRAGMVLQVARFEQT